MHVVLLSGGMDSTTLLAHVLQEVDAKPVLAVSAFYGQKHEREIEGARQVVKHYKSKVAPGRLTHQTITIPSGLFQGSGSSLIDGALEEVTEGTYDELQARLGAQPTVVPNRNMILISMAAALGLSKFGECKVWVAAHAGDAHNYHYPDCTPEFLMVLDSALQKGNSNQVELRAPFAFVNKGEIVQWGSRMSVPYHLTWSCYAGGDAPCGKCATCQERIHAFKSQGYQDPLIYAHEPAWGDCIPYPASPAIR